MSWKCIGPSWKGLNSLNGDIVSLRVYVCLVLSWYDDSLFFMFFGTSNVAKYPIYRYIHLVFLVLEIGCKKYGVAIFGLLNFSCFWWWLGTWYNTWFIVLDRYYKNINRHWIDVLDLTWIRFRLQNAN